MKKNLLQSIAGRPLFRDTVTTTFWSSLGKGAGFLIPFFIAAWFGADSQTDAFFFCYTAIFFISNIIGRVIESVIVPFVAQATGEGKDVGGFIGRLMILTTIGSIILTIAFLSILLPLLPLITRFNQEELRLVRSILIQISPLIVLVLNASILAGTLNAFKHFALPAISPAFRAGIMLLFALLFRKTLGINAVAIGYVLGELARFVILTAAAIRWNIRPTWGSRERVREFFVTAWQQSLGMGAIGLSQMIDKLMASWLAVTGSISILFYAEWLYNMPVIFLSSGLMVTILSHWSNRVYQGRGEYDLKRSMKKTLRLVTFISFLLIIPAMLLLRPIITIAFDRPGFGDANIINLSRIYLILIITLLADMLSIVMTRVCIIYKQTIIIRNLGILRLILKIGLNLLLMPFWGIYGLAVATVLTHYCALFYLWYRVSRITQNGHPDL